MEILIDLFKQTWFTRIFYSTLTLAISLILYGFISRIITKNIEHGKFKLFESKKSKTHIKMIRSLIRYVFFIVTIMILLQINGINVSSMLAGVGILSIIIGFAIQDALKDIIKGIDIISDSYYQVGDVIKFGDSTGKVLSLGLKTTKIQEVATGNIISISNRNIEKVEVVSTHIYINVPLPYELKLKDAEEAINEIVINIKKLDKVDNCEYLGVNNFADSSIDYLIRVMCDPMLKLPVRRSALGQILKDLEKKNISIPYQQIDIHNK